MTENKLYAQCREEAISILLLKYGNATYLDTERQQLTAEIYGMKLLDMRRNESYYLDVNGVWVLFNREGKLISHKTTQDLHDHFVREFNKEVGK